MDKRGINLSISTKDREIERIMLIELCVVTQIILYYTKMKATVISNHLV